MFKWYHLLYLGIIYIYINIYRYNIGSIQVLFSQKAAEKISKAGKTLGFFVIVVICMCHKTNKQKFFKIQKPALTVEQGFHHKNKQHRKQSFIIETFGHSKTSGNYLSCRADRPLSRGEGHNQQRAPKAFLPAITCFIFLSCSAAAILAFAPQFSFLTPNRFGRMASYTAAAERSQRPAIYCSHHFSQTYPPRYLFQITWTSSPSLKSTHFLDIALEEEAIKPRSLCNFSGFTVLSHRCSMNSLMLAG